MRKEYDFSKGKRGAVIAAAGKTLITIMLDDDVIQHFRELAEAQGTGDQTMVNAALRSAMNPLGQEDFQRDLLESVKQMRSGQAARLTKVETPAAEEVSLRLPVEVIERWKATGPGWQQRMSDLLSKTAP